MSTTPATRRRIRSARACSDTGSLTRRRLSLKTTIASVCYPQPFRTNHRETPVPTGNHCRCVIACTLTALLLLLTLSPGPSYTAEQSNAANSARRLKVLFLGDNNHHRPLD